MCKIPRIFSNKLTTSRKNRKCSECSVEIKRGEKYHKISGLWDDSWSNFDYCLDCMAIAEWLDDKSECVPIGGVYDELYNCSLYFFDEDSQEYLVTHDDLEIVNQKPLKIRLK